MSDSTSEANYILAMRDDLSAYTWMEATEKYDAVSTSKIPPRWIDTFTPMDMWASDQESHFKNPSVKETGDTT